MVAGKKGLGKGLGALMVTNDIGVDTGILEIDINKVSPNKSQPRTSFDGEALKELASSIEEIGILQPITVKKVNDYYEIVAGERRWRAARLAGLKKIPVIVKEYDDLRTLEAALIENVQRENLNPLEEALTYARFSKEFNLSQEDIAKKVGKKRSSIANSMRLLKLDKRVQVFLKEGKISTGHGKALLTIEDADLQFKLSEDVIEDSLSVRQLEEIIKRTLEDLNKTVIAKKEDFVSDEIARECKRISKELKSIFGTKVNIKNSKNKGKIEIVYTNIDDLDRIVGLIKSKMQ